MRALRAGRSEQLVLGTPDVQTEKGPSQTDSHVRNATHKSDKPGCPLFPPFSALSLLAFPISYSYRSVVSFLPSSPHLSAWWQSPLHCPHPLGPKGRVPCLHPGVPPPRTHGCCLQSRRELGTFGCRGNGRACSCVPFVCLATARQVLHVTTFLREPVLPWHSSPRLPSSFQHPHRPRDVVLQRLQMQLTAPQSSFFFARKRTPTNAKRRTGLLGIAVHFLILRCLVSSGPS